MKALRSKEAVFFLIILVIGIILVLRVWNIRQLYLSPATRSQIETSMKKLRDDKGWILSSMSVGGISNSSYRLHVRNYHRGVDEQECYNVTLSDSSLSPCDAD